MVLSEWLLENGCNECPKCPGKPYCYEHRNHVYHPDTGPTETKDGGMAKNVERDAMGWMLETETGDTYDKEIDTEARSHNL